MLVSNENVEEILGKLRRNKIFVVDIETTGLHLYNKDYVTGVGIGTSDRSAYYFPISHAIHWKIFDDKESTDLIRPNLCGGWEFGKSYDVGDVVVKEGISYICTKEIVNSEVEPCKDIVQNIDKIYFYKLIDILNNSNILIGFNIKFDLHGLIRNGLKPDHQRLVDCLVMARMCTHNRFADLDLLSTYKNFIDANAHDHKLEYKVYLKKHKIKDNREDIDAYFQSDYCCTDIQYTTELYTALTREVYKTGMQRTLELEVETTRTLLFVESFGNRIDKHYCMKTHAELNRKVSETEDKIFEITKEKDPERVNVLSNLQIGTIFHKFDIHSPTKTTAGKECWDEKVLLGINHPLVGKIKEYRTLRKLRDTYFTPFLDEEFIHPSFKNWGTITGRLSCSEPNLQNIPRYLTALDTDKKVIDEEKQKKIIAMASLHKTASGNTAGGASLASWGYTGDEDFKDADDMISVRRLFISRQDFFLYSFDFSQMEIRVFISYLKNPRIFEEMRKSDFDFHSFVCKLVFGYDETHPEFKFWRQISKAITFGLIYGMGDDLLAGQMGKSIEEAKTFRALYFSKMEGSLDFIESVHKKVEDRGFVFNKYGRRYFLPANRSYVGVNYLIQGSTGDLVKDRMNHVFRYLEGKRSRLINQIHDELLIEVHKDEEKEVPQEVIRLLEENDFGIPLKVDVAKCYPSWAHKVK
jgi:DNA polymerase-1